MYAERAKQVTKNTSPWLACSYFLAILRPATDRKDSALPLVVNRGRSYGFLWAGSIILRNKKEEGQSDSGFSKTPAGAT
jgi:hypothetical protein